MSEKTAPALASIDALLPRLQSLPQGPDRDKLLTTTEALRRAVDAFHMEAIRFRMYTVDRMLAAHGDPECRRLFDDVRSTLEAAGFHTRSHAAP